MNASVHTFNAKLPLATHYQLDGDVYPIADDSDTHAASTVEDEHSDKQPVLSSPECAVVITAGMVRNARLDNGSLAFPGGHELTFLAPVP